MKTKNLLTLALAISGAFFATAVSAQSTTSPDTVCAGRTGAPYYVHATAGSSYHWIVPNGTIASGTNTDSITVDWSATPGTDTIEVVETNAHGCVGDTEKLAVYRMPLPTATLAGVTDSVCHNYGTTFTVALTGIGPWNFSYSDGTTTTPVSNVTSSPYTISTGNLTTTTTYTLTAISNKFGCVGTTSGSGTNKVVVNPKPATSAIYHN